MNLAFFFPSYSLSQLLRTTTEIRTREILKNQHTYYTYEGLQYQVMRDIHLPSYEWREFTCNFFIMPDWLLAHRAELTGPVTYNPFNYSYNAVRITSDDSPLVLLVDLDFSVTGTKWVSIEFANEREPRIFKPFKQGA